ncbi:hypothetical protein FRC10_008477 [Ceratobasidium sp. 414]|nr:hypothetical protein FRC10_008477 [Ceratobasidium sp. 414]
MGVAMGVVGRELREGDGVGGNARLPVGTARLEVTMLFAQGGVFDVRRYWSRSTFTFDTLSFLFFTPFDFNTKTLTASVAGQPILRRANRVWERVVGRFDLEHRSLALALAAAETLITWMIAYPSTFALGKVLLQTSPDRGMRDGRIEGFLRVMR